MLYEKDWTLDLNKIYPFTIMRDSSGSKVKMNDEYINWFQGFCGWENIIKVAMAKINKVLETYKINNFYFTDVKEKFGGLRIYFVNMENHSKSTMPVAAFNKISDIIENLENQSTHTCYLCGDTQTAKIRTDKWWICLCTKCNEKRIKQEYGIHIHESNIGDD